MRRSLIVAAASSGLSLLTGLVVPAVAQVADKTAEVTPASAPAVTPPPVEKATEVQPEPTAATPAPTPAPPVAPTATPAPSVTEPVKPETTAEPAPAVAPKPEAPQVAAPAQPAPFVLSLVEAAQKANPKAGIDKRDLDAVIAFYKARNEAPLWFNDKGRTPDGDALVAEIARAADYGLDPAALDAPALKSAPTTGTPEVMATEEVRLSLAALKYARHARGGRFEPTSLTKFLDRKSQVYEPASVLEQIAQAKDAGAYLRQLHPHHAQFERLRQKYLAMRASATQAASLPVIPDGPKILPGATHPHVALTRARLGLAAPKGDGANENVLDEALAKALKEFQTAKGLKPADGSIANGTRNALNRIEQGNPKKILANMEQWRWMPDDLGDFYVWVNVPEFTLRVVSQGRVIHTERVVVGKTDTQTPIFSDEMEQVIFHPFWGVPDGIKSNEIQPSLAKGQYGVLAKHNLRIQAGGRDIDPATVDWKSADLRRFHVYQPPGGDNVLGVVKFRFPNKHDVYMHDTPSKGLFSSPVRTFSHGCMRVQNPVRLAEIVLAEDKKMATDRVRSLAAPGAPANNQINLTRRIPVHITYFTATIEDDGKARYFSDIYGHESRINLALEGKAHLIARVSEPKGPVRAEPVARLSETQPANRDWMRNVFTNN